MNSAALRDIQYDRFMSLPVRVIGRVDLAAQIRDAVRTAGFDAEVVTASPMSVNGGQAPTDGIDVVVATSMFDPPLWILAKARKPLRPMVAVAEPQRERALRGILSRRNGPDAYVTWPATPDALAAAIRRAEASAARQRSWSVADLGAALVAVGLPTAVVIGGLGMFAAGVGLLIGLRTAWNLRWQAVGGVGLTVLGGLGMIDHFARWLR